MHRQQRPVARCNRRSDKGAQPGCGGGAERQSEFRRANSSTGASELFGVTAAGGGIRTGRTNGFGPDDGGARKRRSGETGLPERDLAYAAGSGSDRAPGGNAGAVSKAIRRGIRGRRALERYARSSGWFV